MIEKYGIEDFNLEDFELVTIMDIVDEGKVEKTWDIEVEDKHHFFVKNPENGVDETIVSHNTAEIVFGDATDEEYLDLKNYKKNPEREQFGWTSNNSVFAEIGMDYTDICKRIVDNGEPGIAWLENMREYSRMKNGGDNKDHRVAGGNPCVVGDTLVNTDKGKLTVEEVVELVKNGEEIKALTFNENTLSLEYNVITNAWLSRKDVSIMTLEIEEDGNIYMNL